MYAIKKAANELDMIVSNMPHMSSVSIGVWIAAGGRHESAEKSGISHFLEHMLFKGTQARSARDLKQAIEGIGGSFNGFTSDEVTCYLVKLPGKFLDLGLEILSDMVLNSKLATEDIKREKAVISEEIKMYRDNPSDHVLELLEEAMWPGHPLGRSLTGTLGTVRAMDREDLLEYRRKMYHPGNMAVVACGKVKEKVFFDKCEELFASELKGRRSPFNTCTIKRVPPRISVSSRDIKQAHLAMGFPVRNMPERARLAAKLMNVILGGNMSSRLFEELRDKFGLCYDISSAFKRHKDVAELVIRSGVDGRNLLRSVTAVIDELRKFKDLGATEDELERAKRYVSGNFLLAMEATSSRMLWLGERFMMDGKVPEVKQVLKLVENVGSQDVKAVLEEIVTSSGSALAVVGERSSSDRRKLKKQMERL